MHFYQLFLFRILSFPIKMHKIDDLLKFELNKMVSRRTNFGERSEPAPDRGGKFQSAGGGGKK